MKLAQLYNSIVVIERLETDRAVTLSIGNGTYHALIITAMCLTRRASMSFGRARREPIPQHASIAKIALLLDRKFLLTAFANVDRVYARITERNIAQSAQLGALHADMSVARFAREEAFAARRVSTFALLGCIIVTNKAERETHYLTSLKMAGAVKKKFVNNGFDNVSSVPLAIQFNRLHRLCAYSIWYRMEIAHKECDRGRFPIQCLRHQFFKL